MGSAQVILLDTHAAVWSVSDSKSLGRQSRRILRQTGKTDQVVAISAVSFWEIGLLVAKRRLRLLDSALEFRKVVLARGTVELPLTGEIAILACELEDLHGDPADRFIAATAIMYDATLVTADERLLKSRYIPHKQNAET